MAEKTAPTDARSAEKRCTKCAVTKPLESFGPHRRSKDRRKYQCRLCEAANSRVFAGKINKARQNKLWTSYRMRMSDYEQLWIWQGGVCAICHDTDPAGNLCVDHDHACCPGEASCGLCVRALICRACNFSLGAAGDNALILRRAADYLEAYR